MIEPTFPMASCVTPNLPRGAAAAGASGAKDKRVDKHLELKKVRISDGYASYFLDQTDYFLLNPFETEVKSSFKEFWKKSLEANKGAEADMLVSGHVDFEGIKKGLEEFKWSTKNSAKDIIRMYDLMGEEFNEATSKLTL